MKVDALGHAARVALWLMALYEAKVGDACGEIWHLCRMTLWVMRRARRSALARG